MTYPELSDPLGLGVAHIPGFAGQVALDAIDTELADSDRVDWHDAHETYVNGRGLTIVQNHFTYALKLSRGDQGPLERIPALVCAVEHITETIRSLSYDFPSLTGWTADELSIHRYDDAETGLSYHKDNLRFIGLIAILSLAGVCDLAVRRGGIINRLQAMPGDLMLLRGTGLVESDQDIRPEHAVINLQTPTRTSLMVRANNRPDESIPGFHFTNWSAHDNDISPVDSAS